MRAGWPLCSPGDTHPPRPPRLRRRPSANSGNPRGPPVFQTSSNQFNGFLCDPTKKSSRGRAYSIHLPRQNFTGEILHHEFATTNMHGAVLRAFICRGSDPSSSHPQARSDRSLARIREHDDGFSPSQCASSLRLTFIDSERGWAMSSTQVRINVDWTHVGGPPPSHPTGGLDHCNAAKQSAAAPGCESSLGRARHPLDFFQGKGRT